MRSHQSATHLVDEGEVDDPGGIASRVVRGS
jgi:hypothetical protein